MKIKQTPYTPIFYFYFFTQVFMEVGSKEITFIERSGLILGFLFGCLQTCLWYFYHGVWVLPVGGFVVRYSGVVY